MKPTRPLLSLMFAATLLALLCLMSSCGGSGVTGPLRIGIVFSGPPEQASDVATKLAATGFFASVAALDASASTPTATQMDQFDVALVMSDNYFDDPVALGDVLSDAIAKGLDVVLTMFTHVVSPLEGRFAANDFFTTDLDSPNQAYDGPYGWTANLPSHPLLTGVGQFTSGFHSYRARLTPKPDSILVASWVGGGDEPLIIERTVANGRIRVDLNFYPATIDVAPDFVQANDAIRIVANALLRAGGQL